MKGKGTLLPFLTRGYAISKFRGVSMVTGVWGEQMADRLLNIADRYQNFFSYFRHSK